MRVVVLASILPVTSLVHAEITNVTSVVITSAIGQKSPIQAAEVIVFDSTGNDIALDSLGVTAVSSGTYGDVADYGPQHAIDGLATPGHSKSFYHSAVDADHSLTINFPQPVGVTRVDIVGRSDCCGERDVYNIDLLDAAGDSLGSEASVTAGSVTRRAVALFEPQAGPEVIGEWGSVKDWPLVSVSMASLPDGRILSYSGSERRTWPSTEQTYSAVWDPVTDTFSERLHTGHNMFCGTLSMLDDGKVFVVGGRNSVNSPWTSAFDFETTSWSSLPNMASGGRWYPSTLTLGDGTVMTAMGSSTNTDNPDLWSPQTGDWRVLNGVNFSSLRSRNHRQTWFPLLSQAPNGGVFHFWDPVETHFVTTDGNGATAAGNATYDTENHWPGIQVVYDEGKLLISGSNDGSWAPGGKASNRAFTVDLNGAAPAIQSIEPMIYPRKFHQFITLPTGEVLAVGGNTTGAKFKDWGSIYEPEVWNPTTGKWRLMAEMAVARDYHSTAMLMTDGRVITAGGGYSSGNAASPGTHQDAQLFSPPYLFDSNGQAATRPVISAALTELNHGDSVLVTGPQNISEFSMIRMSATTHAMNTDQRYYRPSFIPLANGGYQVTVHSNPNVATPGYWMLFAIDDQGVPSKAEVIRISASVTTTANNGLPAEITPIVSSPVPTGASTAYTVAASGTGLTYSWNFGDGSGDTAFSSNDSVTHTFPAPGRYVVSVIVRNASGVDARHTFTQMVHATATATSPVHSNGLLSVAAGNEVWVVNPDNDTVAVVDTATRARTAVIAVGDNPRSLALAPDGKVWVVNKDSASLSIIDTTSKAVVQTLTLDTASRPHGLVFNAHSAYVALEATGELLQLNPADGSETNRLDAGSRPRHLTIDHSGSNLYATNYITPKLPGEETGTPVTNNTGGVVYRFDSSTTALTLQGTVILGHSTRDVSENQGPGMPNYLGPVVISPDGTTAWVPSKQDNILAGEHRGGPGMTFDQTVRAISSKIDLLTHTELPASQVDHDNASVVSHAAFGPNGLTLFTSLEGNRQIALIDTKTDLEYARFDTGLAPQSVLVSDDGTRLYVHNFTDRTLGIYDIEDAVMRGASAVDEVATVHLVSTEALAPNVLRGKQLFYDSRDDRLAGLDYMSCAACHNDGEHDGRTWDFTGLGEGLRNTTTLRGMGEQTGRLHWSANFDEVQDFEIQLRNFNGGEGLMADSDFLTGTTANPFGSPKAGLSADLDALAAYVESLTVALPSPYREANGDLTADAVSGRQLFVLNGCAGCHQGTTFTDSESAALHDVGTIDAATGTRNGAAIEGIDTPSLLGVWSGAPYLHDGSAETLQSAISAHSGVNLVPADLAKLTAFVQQIDSSEPALAPLTPNPNPAPPRPEGPYSALASITIDGQIGDWPIEALVATDPKDATGGNNRLDYLRVWAAHDVDNLYFRYDNHAPNNTVLSWGYSIGIDIDGSVNGYTGSNLPIGIDYMIEGKQIYRYTGDGRSWSWHWLGEAEAALSGATTELGLSRTVVGNSQEFDFIFMSDNSAVGGSARDFVPGTVPDTDAAFDTRFLTYNYGATVAPPVTNPNTPSVFYNPLAAINVDGNLQEWASLDSFGADPDDVSATTNAIDYLEGWAGHDADNFYFAWNNDGPTSVTWGNALFIDTDLSVATGFRGFLNDSPIGIDYLAEGGSVYRYTGTGNNWSWEYLGSSQIAVGSGSIELQIAASMLGNPQVIDIFFRGDSSAIGGNAIDFYPDAANLPLASLVSRRFRYTRDPGLRRADRTAQLDAMEQNR